MLEDFLKKKFGNDDDDDVDEGVKKRRKCFGWFEKNPGAVIDESMTKFFKK